MLYLARPLTPTKHQLRAPIITISDTGQGSEDEYNEGDPLIKVKSSTKVKLK